MDIDHKGGNSEVRAPFLPASPLYPLYPLYLRFDLGGGKLIGKYLLG